MFENLCLFWGGTMGYGNPRTLSDASMRNCLGDIKEFKPTVLVGVPAVWESVKKGVLTNLNKSSFLVKGLFWGALSTKSFLMSTGFPGSSVGAWVLDNIVFRKLKEATGGRLRISLNGGGPISKDTQKFLSMAVAPMIGGYGLTETSAMGALNDPLAWNPNVLGEIPGCIEVKLVDFPDAGYLTTNKPPQGEIFIRGGSVTTGYWKDEEETKAAITEDGWFMTGDIGEFDRNGHLSIIDRKKNLVKTLNGEYIALEKLESVYRSSPVVGNICVYAAQDQYKPIAVIVPVEMVLKKIAHENGIKGDTLGTLVHNEKLNKIVLQQLQAAGRAGGLRGIEIIDGVVLSDEEWTPHNVSDFRAIWSMNLANMTSGFHDRCTEAPAQEDPQPLRGRDQQGVWQEIKEARHVESLGFSSFFFFLFCIFSLFYFILRLETLSVCILVLPNSLLRRFSLLLSGYHLIRMICLLPLASCLLPRCR